MELIRRVSAVSVMEPPLSLCFRSLYAARETCPPGDSYGPQALESLAIFITESGTATVTVDGVPFTHHAGSMLMIAPGVRIVEQVGASEPWRVRYLLIAGVLADTAGSAVRQGYKSAAVVFPSVPAHWRETFGALEKEAFRGADADPWALLGRCADLMRVFSRHPDSSPDADGLRRAAERLLERHPERSWSVPELAAALGTTPRRLTYRLTAATGLAPATWVRRWRVGAARLLLAEGCTVTEAAERLGFANPYHFSRVVRAETGESPSALRHRISESAEGGLKRG